ncbi:DUF1254 domain-containing protein [Streptacidiphilus sp. PAMC 29251]
MDARRARQTAAEGWVYGYALLENYRTMYAQAIDSDDPRYVGGFGVFRHYAQPFTPANTDVVTPNNDTPYSWAWLDLRSEPWVLSVPAEDRYYVVPIHELDTVYLGFVGARSTGREAGHYLVAGPHWDGPVPEGVTGVLRAATQLLGLVGRTCLTGTGAEDVAALRAIQEQYRLRPLHAFAGTPAPEPAPEPDWPVWREEALPTLEFFGYLDFLLGFFPVLPEESELRSRLAALGINGRGSFEPGTLPDELREALAQGMADGAARLEQAAATVSGTIGLFGTRDTMGTDYLHRGIGAQKGLYGLPSEEAWYGGWLQDSAGNRPPDASQRDYVIHFAPGTLPPARFFWSVTMYGLPGRGLVDNPIGRYSIGDRTPGLVYDADGGLTLQLRHQRPADPAEAANWLPAPDGPFSAIIRAYGPGPRVLNGSWTVPPLEPRSPRP